MPFPFPWWAWSMLSNVAIIGTEYFNRSAVGGWRGVLLYTAPLIVMAQYALFRAWRDAPTWYEAWIFFAIGNALARTAFVALTPWSGEIGSWPRVLVGTAILISGSWYIKTGLR